MILLPALLPEIVTGVGVARTAKLKRLTDASVRAYHLDPKRTNPLHDGGGLYLRKRDASERWWLRMTQPGTGREQWHMLFPDDPSGGYPQKTLAMARTEADRLRSIRSMGLDPRAERKRAIRELQERDRQAEEAERQRVTVKALFDRWAAAELTPRVGADGKRIGRKDGGAYMRAQFDKRVFPMVGDASVAQVRKADLMAILDGAKAEGRMRTANVLLAGLKQMFRFALVRELVERNPLDTVTKRDAGGAESSRNRVLSADEIKALTKALPEARMTPRSAAAIWLTLATGCRISEAMGARWEHVNEVARAWYLPDTKNERDHTIHLSEFALRQFTELAALRDAETAAAKKDDPSATALPWVFPNARGDGPVCVKSFGKQLADRQRPPERRMQGRSKRTSSLMLTGGRWTAHDLRRTAATLMAELGFSGDVIDECLNHVIESKVRGTYIRDRRLPEQARAFDALGARLELLTSDSAVVATVAPLIRRVA